MWVVVRSDKLRRIVCEIEPTLGLLRVKERGQSDVIELEGYGIGTYWTREVSSASE